MCWIRIFNLNQSVNQLMEQTLNNPLHKQDDDDDDDDDDDGDGDDDDVESMIVIILYTTNIKSHYLYLLSWD